MRTKIRAGSTYVSPVVGPLLALLSVGFGIVDGRDRAQSVGPVETPLPGVKIAVG